MNRCANVFALLLPAGILAGWVAIAAGQEAPRLAVCRHHGVDGQDARAIDLGKVDREYTKAADAFRHRMKAVEERAAATRNPSHDSGLRACARTEHRSLTLREPLPPKLRSRRLYFLAIAGGDRLPAGIQAPLEPEAVVFLVRYPSLEEAGKLAERLKVGVTPASPALTERLGIRCFTSIVDVSRDGTSLSIQEIAP